MTVDELLGKVRRKLGDNKEPYLWQDEEIIDDYANEVERYMCRKVRRLIRDESTIDETRSTGTITLTGAAGSVLSVTINGVVVTSGATAFNSTLEQTATDLAANITAFASTPKYTAVAAGAVITITAASGTGSAPNGFVIVVELDTLGASCTNMDGGSSLCQMYLVANKALYPKHGKLLEVKYMEIAGREIYRKNDEDLKDISNWRTATGTPQFYIEYQGAIRFYPVPNATATASLTVYRLPLASMSIDPATEAEKTPDIPEIYHDDMILGIMAKCFEKDEEGTLRPDLALKYEQKFLLKLGEIGQEIISRTSAPQTQGCDYGLV